MKIAFVTTGYKPRINGLTTSVESFARIFRKLGHDVTIVTSRYPCYRDIEPGIVRIKSHYLFFDPEDRLANPWLPSSRRIIRKLLDKGFDIIHTHTHFFLEMDALRWAKKIGCPVVYTYHTLFEIYVKHYAKFLPASVKTVFFREWSKWFCRRVDLILAPSKELKRLLESYGILSRVEVNPSGIDLEKFYPHGGGEFRKRNGISERTRVLLFVGRIGGEKNIDFLFGVLKRVLDRYPDTLFLLAGDGPAREKLTHLARRENLEEHVRFLGYLTHETLVPCYDAADLFIFASVTETQGLVLIEAMATGTPVVAVARMGVLDVMEGNRGGILVDLDRNEFTDAVIGLLTDENLYREKSREALAYARQWSIVSMAHRMLGFYREAIERRRALS